MLVVRNAKFASLLVKKTIDELDFREKEVSEDGSAVIIEIIGTWTYSLNDASVAAENE